VFPGRERHSFTPQRLVALYESDLEAGGVDEFIQFHKLLKTELGKLVAEPNQYESGV
jgi:hypothetical protein